MKSKSLIWRLFLLVYLFFSTSVFAFPESGYINDDIQCESIEIKGEDSLYVTGELTYYVEEDNNFKATILFYDIFDKLLAKSHIKVMLIANDDSVPFDAPIHIEDESDPLEVISTHHIKWQIDKIEKSTCCENHGGIIGCDEDSGRLKCYDGSISKPCTCDKYNISE